MRREKLQGDESLEFQVFSFIDDSHSSLAELLYNLIVSNGLANHGMTRGLAPNDRRLGLIRGHHLSGHLQGRGLDEPLGLRLMSQERFDFSAEFIIPSTGLLQKSSASRWLVLEGGMNTTLEPASNVQET